MAKILVGFGGTGAKELESFVYQIAAGIMSTNEKIHMLLVDKDETCGNGKRLISTVEDYNHFINASGFNYPEIELVQYSFKNAIAEVQNSKNGQVSEIFKLIAKDGNLQYDTLVDLLYSEWEQNFDLKNGFYQIPSLGVDFHSIMQKTNAYQNNNKLLGIIKDCISDDGNAKIEIALCGSIFGGTGASMAIAEARYLQAQQGIGDNPNVEVVFCCMLPYFSTPASNISDGMPDVGSDAFYKRSAAHLKYYSSLKDFVKKNNEARSAENKPIFDKVIFSGYSPLVQTCPLYQKGGEDQKHKFHIADLSASILLAEYFNGNLNQADIGINKEQTYCEIMDISNNEISWETMNFSNEIIKGILTSIGFFSATLCVTYPLLQNTSSDLANDAFAYKILMNAKIPLFGARAKKKIETKINEIHADWDKVNREIANFAVRFLAYYEAIQSDELVFNQNSVHAKFSNIDNQGNLVIGKILNQVSTIANSANAERQIIAANTIDANGADSLAISWKLKNVLGEKYVNVNENFETLNLKNYVKDYYQANDNDAISYRNIYGLTKDAISSEIV